MCLTVCNILYVVRSENRLFCLKMSGNGKSDSRLRPDVLLNLAEVLKRKYIIWHFSLRTKDMSMSAFIIALQNSARSLGGEGTGQAS